MWPVHSNEQSNGRTNSISIMPFPVDVLVGCWPVEQLHHWTNVSAEVASIEAAVMERQRRVRATSVTACHIELPESATFEVPVAWTDDSSRHCYTRCTWRRLRCHPEYAPFASKDEGSMLQTGGQGIPGSQDSITPPYPAMQATAEFDQITGAACFRMFVARLRPRKPMCVPRS